MLNVQDDRARSENETGDICSDGSDDDLGEMFDTSQFPASRYPKISAKRKSFLHMELNNIEKNTQEKRISSR